MFRWGVTSQIGAFDRDDDEPVVWGFLVHQTRQFGGAPFLYQITSLLGDCAQNSSNPKDAQRCKSIVKSGKAFLLRWLQK